MPTQFDPHKHHRHSIRLAGYDYNQGGAYYITLVAWQRHHLFGEVVNGVMCLNAYGEIARAEWFKTAELRSNLTLFEDEFVVMPNHVHGIIWINAHDPTAAVGVGIVGAQRLYDNNNVGNYCARL